MNSTAGITGRALRAVKWNYLGTIGRIVATFASQIFLARLLGPEAFGLFGYAFLTVTLLALVVEMGLQQALIQTPELSDEVVSTATGRLLLAGCMAALGVFVSADFIATRLFEQPAAAPVIRAMAPSLVVGAGIAAATAILSRDIEFKVIQLSGLGAYVVGYLVIGVAAGWLGFGVWSLVAAWYGFMVLSCAAMLWFAPRSLRPGNPFRRLSIAGFGNVIMVTNIVNWVIDSAAHVMIGRSFGAASLGQFTVANNLVKVPADHLVRNLQTVLLPLASRAQNNDAGLRRAYLTVLSGVGIIVFPLFTFVALMAHQVVMLLLGARWEGTAALLLPLSVAMIAHAAEALCGPVLTGRGEPRVELHLKIVTLVAMLAAIGVASNHSLVAVAWALTGVFVLRWIWMNTALLRRLQIPFADFLRAMAGPVMLGAVAAAIATAATAAHATRWQAAPEVVVLLLGAAAVALACLALLFLVPGLVLGPYLLQLADRLFVARPALARTWLLHRMAASARRAAS